MKGTSTGAVTDLDGNYTISVSNDAKTLVVTYTGYSDAEVAIGASNIVDVTLSEGVELSEVVVIGYAPIAREKVLGAVSSVKSEEIVENTPVSAFDAVQGRLAGVQILTNGGPGSGFDIKIRGVSTFSSLELSSGVPASSGELSLFPSTCVTYQLHIEYSA